MPELPEVERAVQQIRRIGLNKVIDRVETTQDDIVYSGITHIEFANEISRRRIVGVKRYGKSFFLELDGTGRFPVLHFGMTGMLQVKGEKAMYYEETPRNASTDWPPRFMKFILHLQDGSTPETSTEIAFMDARRLGRIRLRDSPATEPPISALGFDPILCMPALDVFEPLVKKRSCPIKALLLDQSFSAGVGNWVADEILYHARVHPEQRCNTLSPAQIGELHRCTKFVCETAVSVDADDTKFPEDWLFKHRWAKGKKTKAQPLKLPSGQPATIRWVTVGGRTSAYVVELQHLRGSSSKVPAPLDTQNPTGSSSSNLSESDLPTLTDSESEMKASPKKRRKVATESRRSQSRRKRISN
ncbi:AtMMH-1 [Lentinula raphanica]|uniref:AtMMH-1 n=1 Tax=Lentinula raphanica TaxID=153919 RepID=A0AA38UGX4_9AGAR|nr:AtMMH-1 [Lentinula raphanica]